MILTAHQPQYIGGYAGYIEKIASADVYVYMDEVQYSKNDFINRNRIKTNQGEQWLTVPVIYQGHAKIKDIEIDNSRKWRKKHLESIKQAYSRTPYFEIYEGFLVDLYLHPWQSLSDLNEHILKWILRTLNINTKVVKMSDRSKHGFPGFQGTKSELILDMCLKLNCSHFIFGAMAKDYIKPKLFYDAGISFEIQEYLPRHYVQPHGDFLPYMSTLDVMMCKGNKSMDIIRGTK